MAELSPSIFSNISNLFNYSNLQTVLLDIVKVIESLSRDVVTTKTTLIQFGEDKVSKTEFSVFVGAMAGLQAKIDGLESRFKKVGDDSTANERTRKEMETQLKEIKQQIVELEAKVSKLSRMTAPTPLDPEELRKLNLQLTQKVDVDAFRDFREQMLRGEQNHLNLKKSITDALDALNAKAAAAEKYENEMKLRQQQFFDTLKLYNDKLSNLEALKELLEGKLDIKDFNLKLGLLERKLLEELSEKEGNVKELYGALRKKADISQLMELEQILNALMHNEENGTAAGRTHVKCLSCDRVYTNLSGATIDVSGGTQLRKSGGSAPSNTSAIGGKKMMVLGTDGMVYQGRDIPSASPFSTLPPTYEVDVDITGSQTTRSRPASASPVTKSRPRPQSAKRF